VRGRTASDDNMVVSRWRPRRREEEEEDKGGSWALARWARVGLREERWRLGRDEGVYRGFSEWRRRTW